MNWVGNPLGKPNVWSEAGLVSLHQPGRPGAVCRADGGFLSVGDVVCGCIALRVLQTRNNKSMNKFRASFSKAEWSFS